MTSNLGSHSTRFNEIQYCASLKATETFLKNIYDILSQRGRLENSIVGKSINH